MFLVLYIANGTVFCICHSLKSRHFLGVEAYSQNKAVLTKKIFQNGGSRGTLVFIKLQAKLTHKLELFIHNILICSKLLVHQLTAVVHIHFPLLTSILTFKSFYKHTTIIKSLTNHR